MSKATRQVVAAIPLLIVGLVLSGCPGAVIPPELRSSLNDIAALGFLITNNPGLTSDAVASITGTAIALTVPFATDVAALRASFDTTGASLKVGSTIQVSGTTANDFSSPVTYTVTAEDGTTKDYTATVEKSHQLFVFVSSVSTSVVSVIDPATHQVTALSPADIEATGFEPRNLAASPDFRTVYVPLRSPLAVPDVLFLDPADAGGPRFVTEITDAGFDQPYAIAFTADGTEAWVANKQGSVGTGSVSIIDVATHTVIATVNDETLSSPEGIAIANGKADVANRGNNTVSVVGVASRIVASPIATAGEPRYAVATPDGAYVYVSSGYGGVHKVQSSDDTVVANIAVNSRNLAVTPDGTRVYAATQGNTIASISVADDTFTSITVSSAFSIYAVAILSDGSLGFATDESRDVVYVFDPQTDTLLMFGESPLEIPVPGMPRAILAL